MDFDFIHSHNDLGSDHDVSSPSGDRNKIYDLGICIEVESTRFLATLSPMIDTLHSISYEKKTKVLNHGGSSSKRKLLIYITIGAFKASKLFSFIKPEVDSWRETNPNLGLVISKLSPLINA
ncbi:hypothetical protein Tco_0545286 [Tanacetum coccineum]